MKAIALFLSGAFLFAQNPPAQMNGSTIEVGEAVLSLGITKADVQRRFAGYKISCLGEGSTPQCDSWLIEQSNGSRVTVIANIGFKAGRVSRVIKYWDQYVQDGRATTLINVLHDLVAREYKRIGELPSISFNDDLGIGVTQKSVFLNYKHKTITINSVEGAFDSDNNKIPPFIMFSEDLH